MSIRPSDARAAFLVGGGLLLGKAILGPLALIWALNTLFPLSITFSFKSWLAALALLLVLRSFTGKTGRSDADEDDAEYEDEDGDDDTDEYADEADAEDEFLEEAEARRQKLKENLIVYHPAAKKKKGPSDDKS
jgi:hypothetical protein